MKTKFQGRTLYFKHLCEQEQAILEDIEKKWRGDVIKLGLPTREEKLKEAMEKGTWDTARETLLTDRRRERNWFANNKKKFRDVEHIYLFFENLEAMDKEIEEIATQKIAAIGECAEEDAQFEAYSQEINIASFADPEFKIPFFENYDDLDRASMNELHTLYFNEVSSLRVNNVKPIRTICCQGFFLNRFAISEDPFNFLGVPFWKMTHQQSYLVGFGGKYAEIMRHCTNAPDDFMDEPDMLECYSMMINDKGSDK